MRGIEHIEQKLRHEMRLVGEEEVAAITEQFVAHAAEVLRRTLLLPLGSELHGFVHLVRGLHDPVIRARGVHRRSFQQHSNCVAEGMACFQADLSGLQHLMFRGLAQGQRRIRRIQRLQRPGRGDF